MGSPLILIRQWKLIIFIFFFCILLISKITQAQEYYDMSSATHNIQDKIHRVENGLMTAIGIAGEPLTRHNLQEKMKELNIPGASIAVITNGQIEWAKAYGVISSKQTQKITTETRFQSGSVSKPVAAYAILSLVNQNVLNLDQDANSYLTSWKIPENKYTSEKKVTLRHLLSHTSGCNVIGFDGYTRVEEIPTITQTLDGIKPANNPPVRVEFVPGSKMSYSGGGYNIAQQLVEDVTKVPFAEFMASVLLNPLKMDHSTFEHLDSEAASNTAFSHPANGIPMDGGWKSYPESAAAGLWTTPSDLASWLMDILNGLASKKGTSILNHSLLLDMATPQVAVHGLGPVMNGEGNQLELSFKGRTDGFTCGFVSFPFLKQGAVVMINAGNEIAFIDAVLRSIAQEYQWPSYQVKMRKAIPLSLETLERYVGRYGWDDKPNDIYDLFISSENGHLYWKMGTNANSSELYSEFEDHFFSVDTGYDIIFSRKSDDIAGLKIVVQKGYERDFKKIK